MISGRSQAGGTSVPLAGLPPILDGQVETLVLGSFPSPASLAAQRYYAHRQNQFWRVLEQVLGEPLADLDYPARQHCLLRHHVGVWDVYCCCRREGALDSAIQAAETNDFYMLKKNAPQLRRVFFNGKTAARLERWFVAQGYLTFVLPSTSPAYTLAFAKKVAMWLEAWASPNSPDPT